ncbi:Membrane-bound metal-dependent hydrolase [Desulfosarcina cetonica]|uniref:metal-dependent hydrolase n=1 Tax=Desulfosarcina cetonica TaxID=90730 RepID=UPI0006D2025E|nr:metal-dependent hydrolase [Desulfosarcina cetonica]VTR64416.1 Membrane-bound metal-dependent hydrolase [Desulfosarcina cetonica]
MPNGLIHTVAGGLSGLAVAVLDKDENGDSYHNPLPAIGMGAVVGKLPDLLEPSLKNPHHRQFFHSLAVLVFVGYGTKKVYDWQPQDTLESIVRFLTLCAGAAYMSHLILDAMTFRSLPLIGKL